MIATEKFLRWKKFLPAIGLIVFAALCVGYALEVRVFRQIIDLKALVLGSFVVALPVGYEIGHRLTRPFYELTRKFILQTAIMVIVLLYAPLFGSWLNRGLAFQPAQTLNVELVPRSPTGPSQPVNGSVHIWHPEIGIVRVATDRTFKSDIRGTTLLRADLQRGLFGVRYIVPGSLRP